MKVILKADTHTDGTLLEAALWLPVLPVQGDAIEVALPGMGRDHLNVSHRTITPEGDVEVWVDYEGYNLDDLEWTFDCAKAQYGAER